LIGATGLAGPRSRAFDAGEEGDHLIKRFADDEPVDALDVAGATSEGHDLENFLTIIGNDHLAAADVLRVVAKTHLHRTT